ncbi:MAG: TonB-dependent receptor [Magnetococcus sp. DMHC-6]
MKRILIGFSVLSLSSFCNSSAFSDVQEESTMVVTATRMAQTVDETLAAVTVIDRQEIARSGARDVNELLQGQAGMILTQNGGIGAQSSLLLRGTNSGHVLVLVDGIRAGSATLGSFTWEFLSLAEIERIEIVRGPRSSLYGSEAIGGVVQIFTRRGGDKPFQGYVEGSGGTLGTAGMVAGISGGRDRTHFNLSVSHQQSDGFDRMQAGEPDKDGYDKQSIALRLSSQVQGLDLEASLLRNQLTSEYDSVWDVGENQTEGVGQIFGLRIKGSPAANLEVTLTGGEAMDQSEELLDGALMSEIITHKRSFGLQVDDQLAMDHLLTTGVDFSEDRVSGSIDYTHSQRQDVGVFGQYQAYFGKHNFVLGGRWDQVQRVGNQTTLNVAWGYELPWENRLFAAFGTGFKAPTFNQLYDPYAGNPDLIPETSKSWEMGVHGNLSHGKWSLRGYTTQIDHLINWAWDETSVWLTQVDQARIVGVESELALHLADWDTKMSLTWSDPRDDKTDRKLIFRPTWSGKLDLDREWLGMRVGGTLNFQDSRFADEANTLRVAGYGTVDLRATYPFMNNWFMRGSVKNVFDKNYEIVDGYHTEGVSVLVTVGWNGL